MSSRVKLVVLVARRASRSLADVADVRGVETIRLLGRREACVRDGTAARAPVDADNDEVVLGRVVRGRAASHRLSFARLVET
jgi:hypothetical protein